MFQLPMNNLNDAHTNSTPENRIHIDTENNPASFMGDFAEATHDLLMDDAASARAAAAQRLAALGRPLASPYLIAALSDQSWEVRQAAVEGLRDIGSEDALSPLQDLLAGGHQDALLQRAIAQAIETISERVAAKPTVDAVIEIPYSVAHAISSVVEHNATPVFIPEPEKLSAVEASLDCVATEARLRAEKQKQLASEIEALHKAEADQARQIEQANTRRAEAETEQKAKEEAASAKRFETARERADIQTQKLVEDEQQLRAELESLRQSEAERLEQIKILENARLEQEQSLQLAANQGDQAAEAHVKTIAELNSLREALNAAAANRDQTERHLAEQIAALRDAEAEQLRRIEAATASLHAQEQARKEAEEKAQFAAKRAEAETNQVTEMQLVRERATAEAEVRAAEKQTLNLEIQKLKQLANDQIVLMDEAKTRLTVLEEARSRAEIKVGQRAEREVRLQSEVEVLRLTAEEQAARISESEAEAARLREAQTEMLAAAESRRQSEAEAREVEAESERTRVAEAAARRAAEEEQNLTRLQSIRAKAEAASQRRSEQERDLNATLEKLSYAAVQQLSRIQSAEISLRNAEAEAQRLSEQETHVQAALLSQQKAAHEKRTEAAEAARATLQATIELQAQREQEQIANLDRIRAQAELEAQQRADLTQKLQSAIEVLQTSECKQSEEITALQTEAQQRAEAQEQRLAELELIRNQNAVAAQQRSDREQKLNTEIEALSQIEVEQSSRLTELQAALVSLEEQRLKTEAKAKQKAEREQILTAEIVSLREAITAQLKRIAETTEESRRLASEQARLNDDADSRRQADAAERNRIAEEHLAKVEREAAIQAEQQEQQLARLEAIRTKADEEASARDEIERHLNLDIETLRKSEIEQRQRISQTEADLREAQKQALLLAEEQTRLRTEAETLHQEQTRKRRADAEEMRVLLENEAQQRAREEIQQLEELEALRSRIENEAQRRVEIGQQLHAGLEVLRKAEALQLKRIDDAEAESERVARETARSQADEETRLEANRAAHQEALDEQLRAEALHAQEREQRELNFVKQVEEMRAQAERAAQERAHKIEQLNAEIAFLKEREATQTRAIHEAEARLAEFQAACDRLDEEASHTASEDKSRRETFAVERQRRFEEALAAGGDEERRIEEEQRQRNVALEQRQAELAAKAEQGRMRTAQLMAEIQSLEQMQIEQRNRIQEAEAALVTRKTAMEAADDEARARVVEYERDIAEIQSQLLAASSETQVNAETAKELKLAIEKQRKVQSKQIKELEKVKARLAQAEAESADRTAREGELLAKLAAHKTSVEQSDREWPETERRIKAEIEGLRKAESIHAKRFQKLVSRLESEKQKTLAPAASRGRARSAKATKSKIAKPGQAEQWLQMLKAVRNETKLELTNRATKEQQLQAELQRLLKAEADQLTRIEETRARVKEQADAVAPQPNENLIAETIHEPVEIKEIPLAAAQPEVIAELANEAAAHDVVSEPELIQPLETWQFAVVEESQSTIEDAATLSSVTNTEPPNAPAETELELTLRELAKLDEAQSMARSTEIEVLTAATPPFYSSVEIELADPNQFVGSEKSIQTYDEDSSNTRLIEAIRTGTAVERSGAVREWVQINEEEAFSKITELFDDSSVEVRNAAAIALFELKRDCAASFTRALREGSPERRGHIAAAINGSGIAARAIENLIGGSREQTYDAFSMLFLMARAGEVQVLLKTIEQHPEVAVRLSVIKLLTFCNQPNIIPAFRSLAVRVTLPTEVRSAVMEAIYQISNQGQQNSQSAA
jgi:hypothetical protein